jgi:hypothetical protein
MEINFENINKIERVLEILKSMQKEKQVERRWLSTAEAAEYTTYSVEQINKFVKSGELYRDKHYLQRDRKGKRVFDKYELDAWIISWAFVDISDYLDGIVDNIEDCF